jgi:molybdate transport system substrate-binding protein
VKRCLLRVAVALLAALPASCGASDPPAAGRGKVRVAAAANLNVALAELIPRFSAARKVDVTATYGSSGTFFAQLMNGAPFDVFLSADVEFPKRLAERGLVADNGTFGYAVGRIVVWVTGSSPLDPQVGGLRLLIDPDVKRVAVASPETSPYGRAAFAAV